MDIIRVRSEVVSEGANIPEIGSREYNSIRYPNVLGRTPPWKYTLDRELTLKRNGTWRYSKTRDGKITHPARISLKNDITHCIANGLPLKTKSFEYKPLDRSIYLYGKYVATYEGEGSALESFTIKHIDTRETRYRLRDFGIELISKKGKTYWRIKVGQGYYDYLMQLYGNFETLQKNVKDIFPSVFLEKSIKTEDTEFKTILCELRPELEYLAFIPGPSSQYSVYPSIRNFSHSSFIFSALAECKEESYPNVFKPTYYYKDWFENSLGYVFDIKDTEHRKFNLGILLQTVLSNCRLVKKLHCDFKKVAGGISNKFVFSIYGYLFTFYLLDKELQIQMHDELIKYSFHELNISEYFSKDGVILFPTCKEELLTLLKENTGGRIKVYSAKESSYYIPAEIMNSDTYITPLLGKKLLLVC